MAAATGKRTTKRAPLRPSCRSSISIAPPWPSTIARAMARPRPEWRPKSSSGRMRMEAVEDRLARLAGHARPLVLDADQHLVADAGRADLDHAARRREGNGVVDEIVDQPGEPRFVAHDRRRRRPAAGRRRPRRPCRRAPPRAAAAPRSSGRGRSARTARATARRRAARPRRCRPPAGRAGARPGGPRRAAAARTAGSSTRSSVSTAERSEASGFLSSWVTSAAKASVASIRCLRLWVMSASARASWPISSRRRGSTGTSTSRSRPSRTRCAAWASRRSGVGDGPREEARQQDRDDQGRGEDQQQRAALRPHDMAHVARVDGQQQHAAVGAFDPPRRGDIGRAVGRPAQHRSSVRRCAAPPPPRARPRAGPAPAARNQRRPAPRRRSRRSRCRASAPTSRYQGSLAGSRSVVGRRRAVPSCRPRGRRRGA